MPQRGRFLLLTYKSWGEGGGGSESRNSPVKNFPCPVVPPLYPPPTLDSPHHRSLSKKRAKLRGNLQLLLRSLFLPPRGDTGRSPSLPSLPRSQPMTVSRNSSFQELEPPRRSSSRRFPSPKVFPPPRSISLQNLSLNTV